MTTLDSREICKPLYRQLEHLSPTSCACGKRCWRKFFYEKRLGLTSPTRQTVALKYGEAMHFALPKCHGLSASLSQAMDQFSKVWTPELNEIGEQNGRSLVRARLSLCDFSSKHTPGTSFYDIVPPPQTGLTVAEHVSEDELPFALDLGLPIPVVGRIDALGRHKHTKKLWLVEYKTSRENSQRFFSGFAMNPQFTTYCLAGWMLMDERPPGVMLEAIITNKTKTETITFPVHIVEQSIKEVVEWYKTFWDEFSLHEKNWLENGIDFPKSPEMCTTYSSFGEPGYLCDYQTLCLSENWPSLIGLYEQAPEKTFLVDGGTEG